MHQEEATWGDPRLRGWCLSLIGLPICLVTTRCHIPSYPFSVAQSGLAGDGKGDGAIALFFLLVLPTLSFPLRDSGRGVSGKAAGSPPSETRAVAPLPGSAVGCRGLCGCALRRVSFQTRAAGRRLHRGHGQDTHAMAVTIALVGVKFRSPYVAACISH